MIKALLSENAEQKIEEFYDKVAMENDKKVIGLEDLSYGEQKIFLREVVGDLILDMGIDFLREVKNG